MPVENINDLYDFETAIESGFKNLFASNDLKAFTSNDGDDDKRPRPRVELFFTVGAETGHRLGALPYFRADAFAGQLLVIVVSNTRPVEVGTQEHSEFRSAVRNLMAKATYLLKVNREAANDMMPNHAVHSVVHSGSTPSYESDQGYYETTIQYDLKFSIQPEAWPEET
ncbi:MAG: hypothetical protein QM813_26385 [Verrucomicrobiota bacterium]